MRTPVRFSAGRLPATTPTGWPTTRCATLWTTNESGGSETVLDADTGQVRGTVPVGGDAGDVAYDPTLPLTQFVQIGFA
jgi:hypothetical protein